MPDAQDPAQHVWERNLPQALDIGTMCPILHGILWATLYGLGSYTLGNNVHRLTGPVGSAFVTLAAVVILASLVYLRLYPRRWRMQRDAQ